MGGARSSETKEPSSGESSPVGGEQSNSSREPPHPGCFFYGQVRFVDTFFRTRIFQVSSCYDSVVICLVLSTSLEPHAVSSRVQAFVRRYQGPRLMDHCRNVKCRLQLCVAQMKGRRFNCNRLVFLVHRTSRRMSMSMSMSRSTMRTSGNRAPFFLAAEGFYFPLDFFNLFFLVFSMCFFLPFLNTDGTTRLCTHLVKPTLVNLL